MGEKRENGSTEVFLLGGRFGRAAVGAGLGVQSVHLVDQSVGRRIAQTTQFCRRCVRKKPRKERKLFAVVVVVNEIN